MISKGIFGIGCSYMWGEGLYYYSNLPDLWKKRDYTTILMKRI